MKKYLSLGVVASLCLAAPSLSQASPSTWTTAGSGLWSTTGNWTGGVPTASSTTTFNTAGSNGNETIYLNGNQASSTLTFQNTGATTLLGGISGTPAANTLALGGNLTVSAGAGAVTIGDTTSAAPVNLAFSATASVTNNSSNQLTLANGITSSATTGTQTLTLGGAGAIVSNGVIGNGSGTVALSISGATGGVTLNGANTFTGGISVGSGTLTVTNASGFGGNTTAAALSMTNNGEVLNLLNDGSGNNGTIVFGPGTGENVTVSKSVTINVDHSGAHTGNTIQLGGLTDSGSITFTNGDGYNLSFGASTFSTNPVLTNNMTSGTLTLASLTNSEASGSRTVTFAGTSASAVTSVGAIAPGTGTNTVALVQAGTGTLQLTGINTYTGSTTIASGTLSLANSSGAATGASALILNGGTLSDIGSSTTAPGFTSTALNYGSSAVTTTAATKHILSVGAITRTASEYGVINFNPASTTGGAAGSITSTTSVNSSNIIGGWATVNGSDYATVSGGTITTATYTPLTVTTASAATTNFSLTNSSVTLSGNLTANSLRISDSGTTDGINTNGKVISVGAGTGGILLTGGGTYTISGTGNVGAGTSSGAEFIVNVNTGSNLVISAPVITATSGSGILTKAGSGTLTIQSTNNGYQQATNIDGGTLVVSSLADQGTNSSIGNGSAVGGTNGASNLFLDGGTLQYVGGTTSTNRFFSLGSDGGGINASGTGAVTFSGSMVAVPSTASTETLTLSGTNTGANTISGVLPNGGSANTVAVAKSGTGTWVLSGANTYTGGTTVTAGKLLVTNTTASATSTGAVNVTGSTAIFGGSGKVAGAINLSSGGNLYSGAIADATSTNTAPTGPGAASVSGTSGGMTLSSALNVNGGTLTFALSNAAGTFASPALTTSYLTTTGTVSFTGSDTIDLVDLSNGGLTLRNQNAYLLISATSGSMFSGLVIENSAGQIGLSQNGFTGTVLGVSDGGSNPLAYTAFTFNQFGSDGVTPLTTTTNYNAPYLYLNGNELEVVPEPGTWALMLGGLALLIVIQRRKNKLG